MKKVGGEEDRGVTATSAAKIIEIRGRGPPLPHIAFLRPAALIVKMSELN